MGTEDLKRNCMNCLRLRNILEDGRAECMEFQAQDGYAVVPRFFIRPQSTSQNPCPEWREIPKKVSAESIPSRPHSDFNWLFSSKDENRKPPRGRVI